MSDSHALSEIDITLTSQVGQIEEYRRELDMLIGDTLQVSSRIDLIETQLSLTANGQAVRRRHED